MNSLVSRGTVCALIISLFCLLVVAPVAAQQGAAIFKQKCAVCHGPDGKGQTAIGKSMKLRDLGSADVQKQSDAELKTIVDKGKGKMPAQKLTAAQTGDVVKYVRTFKK